MTILASRGWLEQGSNLIIKALHVLGWLAVVTVAALSLIPGGLRPHVTSSNSLEHFAAYLIVTMLLTAGGSKRAYLIKVAILLMFCAGVLEIIQIWIPGRNSTIADFAAGTAGIWCGVLWMFLSSKWIERSRLKAG